ncbi:MAG: class I SAM-dependent methyltransferase [Myxococcota bacterium]
MTATESTFDPRWLRMREPYDHAARSVALVDALAEALPSGAVTLVDLGCGLGSNLRFVAPRLARPQRWLLVDHDPVLLEHVPDALGAWALARGLPFRTDGRVLSAGAIEAELVQHDLRAPDPWPDGDATVTQAVLDLVDTAFLERLAERVPLLAALTVDGRLGWHPSDPDDAFVHRAFRAHQLGDRGFGASPGPHAAAWLAGRLAAAGHRTSLREADWASDPAMTAAMIDGIAHAAAEIDDPDRVRAWVDRRRSAAAVAGGALSVGHLDLLAVAEPPAGYQGWLGRDGT